MRENNENFPFPFEGKKRKFPYFPFEGKKQKKALFSRGKKKYSPTGSKYFLSLRSTGEVVVRQLTHDDSFP